MIFLFMFKYILCRVGHLWRIIARTLIRAHGVPVGTRLANEQMCTPGAVNLAFIILCALLFALGHSMYIRCIWLHQTFVKLLTE